MNIWKVLVCIVCFFVTNIAGSAQSKDSLVVKFDRYRTRAAQEKIYVHIDRTSYLTGELLWFKIYYVDGTLHKSLNTSKIAYVEIVDRNNEAVVQTKVSLSEGAGDGSLFIPAVLNTDNYILRVYTQWMKNFGPEFYFHQPITIINPFIKSEQDVAEKLKPIFNVQFFPEGGHVVAGLKNKIGFKVTDFSGKGVGVRGKIVDSRNDTVCVFSPLRFGIGHFYFSPEERESYRVIISDENGRIDQGDFPKIEAAGYIMSVTDNGAHIAVDVKSKGINASLAYLFAHTRLSVVKVEGKYLYDGGAQFIIPKSELGEGITHLTIFDQHLKPVCERLFFKRPIDSLSINIKSTRGKYKPRDLVQLALQANALSDVSVSIYQRDSIPSPQRHNIFDYLWLNSDLTGEIESPGYYFQHTDSEANIALDNLMLTHGWRRFRWNDVLNSNTDFKYIPEYRKHLIHGKVSDEKGSPVGGALTSLSWPNEFVQFYGSRSDEAGNLWFEVDDLYDERKIFLHIIPRLDSSLSIKIENPFSDRYTSNSPPPLRLSHLLSKSILNRSIAMQVQSTFNYDSINKLNKQDIDSIPFYGKPDRVYYLDDYIRFPLLEEVLREYVAGVFVRKRKDTFHFTLVDNVNNNTMMREEPLVLFDGVPVLDNNKLLEYSALKVKKIEVVNREYNYGPFVFSGILSFYTYRGDLEGFEIDTKNLVMNYDGLQSRREFYSPSYQEPFQTRSSRTPDKRTLLYWNASLAVGDSTNIEFYTSDVCGEYEIVVEGITKDGRAGSSTHYFMVAESED